MKRLMLLSLLMFGMNFAAHAGTSEIYPSGPSNLLPASNAANSVLWAGGAVAKELFQSMVQGVRHTNGTQEVRFGRNLSCLHDSANGSIEYSCAMTIELSTGTVVPLRGEK